MIQKSCNLPEIWSFLYPSFSTILFLKIEFHFGSHKSSEYCKREAICIFNSVVYWPDPDPPNGLYKKVSLICLQNLYNIRTSRFVNVFYLFCFYVYFVVFCAVIICKSGSELYVRPGSGAELNLFGSFHIATWNLEIMKKKISPFTPTNLLQLSINVITINIFIANWFGGSSPSWMQVKGAVSQDF